MKSAILSLALAAVSSAAPAGYSKPRPAPRPAPVPAPRYTDADILQYALTLEHLEDAFYRGGLAQYTADDFTAAGFSADIYNKFVTIAADEATHVSFLTSALAAAGQSPVAECTYNFGYTDVASFVATSAILEGVGVSAYLGAAASIINKGYLTAAGSILTIESKHVSYVRNAKGQEPFPQPFDDPLTLKSVYTLASSFITSCPSSNVALPLKAYPKIAASSTDSPINVGRTLTLTTTYTSARPVYAAFVTVTGPIFVDATKVDGGYTVVVPSGVAGQSYVVLTWSKAGISDTYIRAGPALVEIAGTTATQ